MSPWSVLAFGWVKVPFHRPRRDVLHRPLTGVAPACLLGEVVHRNEDPFGQVSSPFEFIDERVHVSTEDALLSRREARYSRRERVEVCAESDEGVQCVGHSPPRERRGRMGCKDYTGFA